MLHYQSALLQSLATVFYSLPMVLGFAEEKQIVRINLFEEYVEDSVSVGWLCHVGCFCLFDFVWLALNLLSVSLRYVGEPVA